MHSPKSNRIAATSARLILSIALIATTPPMPAHAQDSPLDVALSHLQYRSIGPAVMGGRIADLAVVESKPQVFYVGAAAGGVWKTENHGTSWTPLFDDQPTGSIGDVTLHQANPNVVWVGTGEPQNRQSSPWGNGVYKSTDAGATWTHMGLEETRHIGRILIHPRDPDVVYVAAVGDLWSPSEARGVYRTEDGGESWQKVLYLDEHTGAIDLAMDPGDPKTIFAAMYQRRRTGWGFNGGGPGSGLYRTSDGGETWSELTQGLPGGDKGRIGVDVFRGDGNVVFALIEADARDPEQGRGGEEGDRQGGTFRSVDRGETWEKMSDTNPRPMYYSQIHIDPSNPDRIYVLGGNLMVSDDAGRTFRDDGSEQIHVDHHALWINPNDSDHLIIGNDGGVAATWDGTRHWRIFDNIPLGQFYQIGFDMRDPYHVCGGLQDSDVWCGPSNTRSIHGIRNQDWEDVKPGDGFFTLIDPSDSTVVFAETQGGNLIRYDRSTGESTPIRPIVGPREEGDTTKEYRFNWNAPLHMSPQDSRTIYLGANYLMRSRDRGMTWEELGAVDLTKQIDRETLEIMGVAGSEPQMSVNDGISAYGTLTAVAESPLNGEVIYAGSDDGNVQVSLDGGATWENVVDRVRGLPERTYVSRLVPSAHEPGRVYATFDGHRNGDYAPYAYVSEDYGQSWRAISGGLPDGWSVNVITEHHRAPNLLFLGNEIGVYVSVDRGETWRPLKNNLPVVPVDDILIHPRENDLIVGTHGRSIWIMEDITPLEHVSDALMAEAARVFPIRSTTKWFERGEWPFPGATFSAPNPRTGALIRYYLREAVAAVEEDTDHGPVTLTITDAAGQHVRSLEAPGSAGINEVVWDLRYDRPYEPEQEEGPSGGGGFGGGAPQGPIVLPGSYTVSLDVGEQTSSSTVEVIADPRRPMSQAHRLARQEVLMELHALAKPIYQATQSVEHLDELLEEAGALVDDSEDASERIREELEAIEEELAGIEEELTDARQNARIGNAIQGSSTLPTEDQIWQVDAAWEAVPPLIQRLNLLIETRVPAFYELLNEQGIRPSAGDAIPLPRRSGG